MDFEVDACTSDLGRAPDFSNFTKAEPLFSVIFYRDFSGRRMIWTETHALLSISAAMKGQLMRISVALDAALSHALKSMKQTPAEHSVENHHEARRSWPGNYALVAVAIVGAIGLGRLAHHVATPGPETNGGIIVRSEVASLWLHPALFELAQRPSESPCRSLQEFRQYAEEWGLEKAWYVITVKVTQTNGEMLLLTTICRPYEMDSSKYLDFLSVLATAAGKPPANLSTDFRDAKIGVIPDYLLDADPRATLDELRMQELLPGQDTALKPGSCRSMKRIGSSGASQ